LLPFGTGVQRMRRISFSLLALLGSALGAGCGTAAQPPESSSCTTVVYDAEVAVPFIDRVDLLIVIDDSEATEAERAGMRRGIVRLVRTLLSGQSADGTEFRPLRDLHVGVLSADLGGPGCTESGASGALAGATCDDHGPAFARYFVPNPTVHPLIEPPSDEPITTLLSELECRLAAASPACRIGQSFEAALRALWPAAHHMSGSAPKFEAPPPEGDGANAGFLRNDPKRGLSFLHVLLVTDGDDCSIADAERFASGDDAEHASGEARCAAREAQLHAIERYVAGLRALRPGYEHLVSFSAVAGVPPDLLAGAERRVDFDVAAQHDAFYDALLADPRMQPSLRGDGTLMPSCERAEFSATPPRRVVELARAFGRYMRLASLCDDDWSSALTPLTDSIAYHQRGGLVVRRKFERDRDGLVPCHVLWELPAPEDALEGTPVACEERSFLSVHESRPRNARGGAVCEVRQLPVLGAPDDPLLGPGDGWFYDDFSLGAYCGLPDCAEIFFKPDLPPTGVLVKLQCVETLRPLPAEADLTCDGDGCPEGWSCGAGGRCEPDECTVPG
jgi:hypothetical protein